MAINLQSLFIESGLKGKLLMAGGTLVAAASIGLAMQAFDDGPSLGAKAKQAPVKDQGLAVQDVTLTSSALIDVPLPSLSKEEAPAAQRSPAPMPEAAPAEVIPASQAVDEPLDAPGVPELTSACEITLEARPAKAAMVALDLTASCLPNAEFVLHHSGMMFSAQTDSKGTAFLTVPALAEQSVFIASFDNGEGAVVRQDVPNLGDYGRVVVQWRGDAGLGLHAREYGAAYFSEGHIHAEAKGSVTGVERGSHGVLQRFGSGLGPNALKAEVYTYPVANVATAGQVEMSVEAEITARNCNVDVEAQTLQLSADQSLQIRDVTLFMPKCDALGDFLVLKNLVEDMTLAAK